MTALLLTLAFVLGTMVPAGGYLQNLDEPGIEWTEGNGTAYEWLDSYPEMYD